MIQRILHRSALAIALGTLLISSAAAVAAPSKPARANSAPAAGADPGDAAAKPAKPALAGTVNINTANAQQLMLLPGVGPTKAERVVAWRKANGSFKRVKDLRRVKGFGRKTLERLAPYLTITGETTLAKK